MKLNDSWYDPPFEEEAKHCEHCGQEMALTSTLMWRTRTIPLKEWVCNNEYCPNKHTGVAHEMACWIVELDIRLGERQGVIEDYRVKYNILANKMVQYQEQLNKYMEQVDELTKNSGA